MRSRRVARLAVAAVAAGAGAFVAVPAAPSAAAVCDRVPLSGTLAPGQTAVTPQRSARRVDWSAGSAGQSFRYTLVSGSTNVATGTTRLAGSALVPLGTYRMRITNLGVTGQSWRVCWS